MTEQDLTKSTAEQANGVVSERVEKRHGNAKSTFSPKVFVNRNSLLTDLMEVSHLQTVFNISVAVCCLLVMNTVLYYVVDPQKFWTDMKIMYWATGKMHIFVAMWLGLNMACLAVYHAFCIWAVNRYRLFAKLMDFLFITFFVSIAVLMITAVPRMVIRLELPPITALSILSEMVRMFMKIYSFVRECYPRIRNLDHKSGDEAAKKLCPPLSHFVYYMFAPVLLYRDSYPRSKSVQWRIVALNFLKVIACIFITYCLVHVFITGTFKKVGVEPFHLPHLVLVLAGCIVVGSIMMFLLFYAILHSWLNAFAEMLRFGDRLFYTDWWNSTSFSQYYRRWNLVVYDWLYTYIHGEMYSMGFSRSLSMVTVFIVSAAFHEFIICFALGFFFPALAITYCLIGVPVVFVTRSRTAQTWNTFMWGMLFSGWGLLIMMYSLEWYARRNCKPLEDRVMDVLVPRFLYCGVVLQS